MSLIDFNSKYGRNCLNLANSAGGPGFKSRVEKQKIGFKNKSLRETFGLRVIWGP